MTTRIENDPLGEKPVPSEALYGIQTVRAVENFPISGLKPLPAFVEAVVWIKRSAALTHKETGRLDARLADAIVQAADEILAGALDDEFPLFVWQTGSGTQTNMNVNEVISNRAIDLAGGERGSELERRLRPVGARVDERQRLALEQVAVDRAGGERERQGDRHHGHAGHSLMRPGGVTFPADSGRTGSDQTVVW